MEHMVLSRLRRSGLLPASVLAAALGATGCGGGGGTNGAPATPSAATLLQRAKATFDATSAFHVDLTGSNLPGSATGLLLTSATGDAVRPDGFSGTLTVEESGLPLSVPVVSLGGTFYAKTPFSGAYTKVSPGEFGFSDPGQLLNVSTGISSLLPATQSPTLGSQVRVGGELLQEVKGTVTGQRVKSVLIDAQPSEPVDVTYDINTSTNQLREVVLTGPILVSGQDSTFTLLLTRYGENVSVTPPPA